MLMHRGYTEGDGVQETSLLVLLSGIVVAGHKTPNHRRSVAVEKRLACNVILERTQQ